MSKTSFLFWNLNKRPLTRFVAEVARLHDVDVLMLAECTLQMDDLLVALNDGHRSKFSLSAGVSSGLVVLTRFPRRSIRPVSDSAHLAMRRLIHPVGVEVLLVAAHLPSKRFQSSADQLQGAILAVQDIEAAELRLGHSRTVLCGDLNMDPFDPGMVGATAFHGVMSRQTASRDVRTVQGDQRRFFYNPMWSFYGDHPETPAGTYHYGSSAYTSYFWHMFDQVLIRPSLLPRFATEDTVILTSVGETSLLTDFGVPDSRVGSDHLPLLFRLDLSPKETNP